MEGIVGAASSQRKSSITTSSYESTKSNVIKPNFLLLRLIEVHSNLAKFATMIAQTGMLVKTFPHGVLKIVGRESVLADPMLCSM